MKKAVAILSVFIFLFLVSCTDGSETTDITNADKHNVIESLTEKIIESVTDNELCSVPTAPDGFVLMTDYFGNMCVPPTCGNSTFVASDYLPCAKTLDGDNEKFIGKLLEGKWQDGIINECVYDATIHYMTFTYYYSSDCGTLTDIENQRSMPLTKSQIHRLNIIISKYGASSKNAVLSRSVVSKDGVHLRVELSDNPVKSGERFILTATVTNNSGKTIYVTMPTGTPNRHYEIRVKITDGKYNFVDADTQGKEHTDDMGMLVMNNGESYTQEMNMVAGYLLDGSNPLEMNTEPLYGFAADVYKGTATFYWNYEDPFKTITSAQHTTNKQHTLELEFAVQVK